jgi:hypothetical protein
MAFFRKLDPVLLWSVPAKTPRKFSILGWLGVLFGLGVGSWWQWHLPTVGKAGLALAIGATLMPLIWEKAGVVCKMTWIAMLFVLLSVEYRAIDRDHDDAVKQQAAAFKLAKDTADDAHQTYATVIVLPKMISDTRGELMAAEKKRDPAEIARLQSQLKSLERQKLLELTLELREEMKQASSLWSSQDYLLQASSPDRQRSHDTSLPEEERKRATAMYTQKREQLNIGLTQQNSSLLIKANDTRAALLLLVPSHDKKDVDAIYAKVVAGHTIDWVDMQKAANYLDSLYYAAIKPAQPIQPAH